MASATRLGKPTWKLTIFENWEEEGEGEREGRGRVELVLAVPR
jgi:hypothetical protein